ncbi:hypothetical protein ACFSLT_05615 [Novosphingobium resinovorum]
MELSDGIEVEPGCTVSYPAARQSFTENKTPRPGEDAPDADPMFASDALTFPAVTARTRQREKSYVLHAQPRHFRFRGNDGFWWRKGRRYAHRASTGSA